MKIRMKKFDSVSFPSHYNQGDVQCIEAIRSCLGKEGFKGYCRGSAIKYIWRTPHKKNPVEDLQKAKWFINQLEKIYAK